MNRTARRPDGEALNGEIFIKDITLAQAQELEYGSWKAPEFKGEPIPLLLDLLNFAQETQIPIKLDNVWEKFPEEIRKLFFQEIAERGEKIKIGFTCTKLENLNLVAERFPYAELHYDGGDLPRGVLEQIAEISTGRQCYIWVCYDNDMTKWFQGSKATPELCALVRQYGELGIWILSKREEIAPAIRDLSAQVIETTGHIKPHWLRCFAE